ncbi:hypothetical protein [Janthinobacterium lividum]|jgi:hypothetical protein|nr:hypothetical protein [Janthinobacterium lividum]MCL6484900.1 hypothetical protein [Janthinobacterium lividum]
MNDANVQTGSIEPHIVQMEPGVKESATILSAQLIDLHIIWTQYCQLYEDAGSVEVLNRSAGLFFKIVQDVLWDRVLLGICRFIDPAEAKGGKNKNLTLRSLAPLIADIELKGKVQDACNAALSSAEFALNHRNKRIAHQDHYYATAPELFEMSPVSRRSVEEMLENLRAVMRLIDSHYNDTDVLYDKTVLVSGADRVVVKLKKLEKLVGPSI